MHRLTSPWLARLRLKLLGLLLLSLSIAQPALAHPDAHGAAGSSLLAGLLHPLQGLDHAVLLLAVGLWIALQRRAPAARGLPASVPGSLAVLGVMALGAAAGRAGWLPLAADGAVASLLVALGALIALAVRPPRPLALALVGLSVLLHGAVHGAAYGAALQPFALYAAGLLATSGALLAAGAALARLATPARAGVAVLPALGVGVAAVGLLAWLT
jgi:urease accessory protein